MVSEHGVRERAGPMPRRRRVRSARRWNAIAVSIVAIRRKSKRPLPKSERMPSIRGRRCFTASGNTRSAKPGGGPRQPVSRGAGTVRRIPQDRLDTGLVAEPSFCPRAIFSTTSRPIASRSSPGPTQTALQPGRRRKRPLCRACSSLPSAMLSRSGGTIACATRPSISTQWTTITSPR
jgi:hypothetical protein